MKQTIKLKGIKEENFNDYRKASLYLAFPYCSFKCCKEKGYDISICQNNHLKDEEIKDIELDYIYNLYYNNILTESICLGGLEPLDSFDDVLKLIQYLRFNKQIEDDIIIYTGYYKSEISDKINQLIKYKNIYFKFGRFIMGDDSHYDEILGVNLVSKNQYGEKIS